MRHTFTFPWGYVAGDPDAGLPVLYRNAAELIVANSVTLPSLDGIRRLIASEQTHVNRGSWKIGCIRILRCLVPDLGLREAKDLIETLAAKPRLYTFRRALGVPGEVATFILRAENNEDARDRFLAVSGVAFNQIVNWTMASEEIHE